MIAPLIFQKITETTRQSSPAPEDRTMPAAPVAVAHEAAAIESRQGLIERLDLHGHLDDLQLDAVVETLAAGCGAPVAFVNIVTRDLQTYAAEVGVGATCTSVPDRLSFCAEVVATGLPLQVTDATKHPRYAENPLVMAGTVCSYAGEPLVYGEHVIGSVAIFDVVPREFAPGELRVLAAQARLASAAIELRVAAAEMTGSRNTLTHLNEELLRSHGRLDEAQLSAGVGSWEVDVKSEVVTWSRELARCFEFPSDLIPSYEALIERTHPADRDETVAAIEEQMSTGDFFELEHRLQLPSGAVRWISARGHVELDASGEPSRVLGTVRDITRERDVQDALQFQASHDSLTGLPNRDDVLKRLTSALANVENQPGAVGVIYLDIDRFHLINDSLGLQVGDELLVAAAARITAVLPPDMPLARIGGDEFAVICTGSRGTTDVLALADWICEGMANPIEWAGGHLVMSVSAGVALATSASVAPHELLRDANAAMYVAKRSGRARSAQFEETMRTRAVARMETEVALRRSIADGDLRVHYQQIVSLDLGRPLGHEALVRWNHPTRGLVAPDEFITIAEETGLIVPLGAWVLREACMQARRFQCLAPQWSRLTMSVNLSGGQLTQPDLVEMIAAALRDTDLRSEHLQLEMTESVLMDDAAKTVTVLQQLKGLGVKLGVDDFGTGYSSMAYLRRFPVDVLKIDRTFVDGLGKDLEDSAVTAAVVSLADTLGLATVAEGVETELQRDCLLALGCERAQGYLFARPVPPTDAELALGNLIQQR